MAGDWIKFEITTPDKPEVWSIAQDLDIDPDAVVGKMLRIWSWFDQHTESGNTPSVTKKLLDRIVGVTGFCDAVIRSGWMTDNGSSISLPNFDIHNGKTAKNRAVTAKRVAAHKEKKRLSNDDGNGVSVTEALPKEEKRREDNKNPLPPKNGGTVNADRFQRFWKAYPLKKAIGQAEKAFGKINPDDLMLNKMIKALQQQAEHRENLRSAGQFVPGIQHPSTWLNARGWQDEPEPIQQRSLTGTHLPAVGSPALQDFNFED